MENVIVIAVAAGIVFLAGRYIYREKKKGAVCVGCPYSGNCGRSCSGGCGNDHGCKK